MLGILTHDPCRDSRPCSPASAAPQGFLRVGPPAHPSATIFLMFPAKKPARTPRWFWIPLRVLIFTVLCTLIAFAVSLLLGIIGVVAGARMRGGAPNMTVGCR